MKTIWSFLILFSLNLSQAADTIPELYYIQSESGKYGLVDLEGKLRVDTVYDAKIHISLNHEYGEAIFKKDGKWLLINYKNEMVLDLSQYSSFSIQFKEGMLAVTDAKTGKSGYVNRKGEAVIPFVYDLTHTFDDETQLAVVSQNGKWGIIDVEGKWVVSPKYDHIYEIVSKNEFIVMIDEVYYGVNLKGEILYEEEIGC